MTNRADRGIWIGLGVAVVAVGAAVGVLAWEGHKVNGERETFAQPYAAVSQAEMEAIERSAKPPRPPSTRPAVEPQSLPPVTFADGTTARVLKVERLPADRQRPGRLSPSDWQRVTDETPTPHLIRLTVEFNDAQASEERDHLVRIDGRPVGRRPDRMKLAGDTQPRVEVETVVDADADRVSVDVAAAVGPSVEAQRIAPGDAAARQNHDAPRPPVRFAGIRNRPNATLILCEEDASGARQAEEQSWVMYGVLRDGRRVAPSSTSRGSDVGLRVAIPAPPKELEYVTYRCRPYEWQAIGEVALPPAPATQPAEAGGSRAQQASSASN